MMIDYHITFGHLLYLSWECCFLLCVCKTYLRLWCTSGFQIPVIYFSSTALRSLVDIGKQEALVGTCSATAGGLVLPGKLCWDCIYSLHL